MKPLSEHSRWLAVDVPQSGLLGAMPQYFSRGFLRTFSKLDRRYNSAYILYAEVCTHFLGLSVLSSGSCLNNKLGRICKEAYYPSICVEGLRKLRRLLISESILEASNSGYEDKKINDWPTTFEFRTFVCAVLKTSVITYDHHHTKRDCKSRLNNSAKMWAWLQYSCLCRSLSYLTVTGLNSWHVRCWRGGKALHVQMERCSFEISAGHRLSWLSISWFSSASPWKCCDSTPMKTRPILFTSFQIHISSVILPLNSTQSVTERCGQSLRTSSTYQQQEKMSISSCV
jgi:hypothetical protein